MATKKRPNSKIERFVIEKAKELRKKRGMSQKDLAIRLNVSTGFIGDVENTKYRAKYNLSHINELAKIFECSPGEFLPVAAFNEKK